MNASEYRDKFDQILFDKSKFTVIQEISNKAHPVIRNENSIKNYLQKNVKSHISKEEYDKICPSGSQPGQ